VADLSPHPHDPRLGIDFNFRVGHSGQILDLVAASADVIEADRVGAAVVGYHVGERELQRGGLLSCRPSGSSSITASAASASSP